MARLEAPATVCVSVCACVFVFVRTCLDCCLEQPPVRSVAHPVTVLSQKGGEEGQFWQTVINQPELHVRTSAVHTLQTIA